MAARKRKTPPPPPPPPPQVKIEWGGKQYEFATPAAARAAGFQLEGVGNPQKPAAPPKPLA